MTEIKGKHVFFGFALAFGTIITANLTLAYNAVRTFPGLEVKNSYIASQKFEAAREAQDALNWNISAGLSDAELTLRILENGKPVKPVFEQALFGRATSVARDQNLKFTYNNGRFTAPVDVETGNWNLRIKARSADGTLFARRIVLELPE